MRGMQQVFEKKFFFFTRIILEKNFFVFVFPFQLLFFKQILKYIILIVLAGRFIINVPYHLNK